MNINPTSLSLAGPILAIGFRFSKNQTLWIFFSFFSLALLTLYQVVHFALIFYQVIRVFVDQRRIEMSQSDEAHFFQGLGWVAVGLKLGVIESIIGFVPAGFESAILRRVLRFLGRACLIVGVIKG